MCKLDIAHGGQESWRTPHWERRLILSPTSPHYFTSGSPRHLIFLRTVYQTRVGGKVRKPELGEGFDSVSKLHNSPAFSFLKKRDHGIWKRTLSMGDYLLEAEKTKIFTA